MVQLFAAEVAFTVYVILLVGLTAMLELVDAVLQVYVPAPLAEIVMVLPVHMTVLLGTKVIVGVMFTLTVCAAELVHEFDVPITE